MSPAPAVKLPNIVRRIMREPTVPISVSFELLGLEPASELGYRMAKRYRMRIAKAAVPIDLAVLRPRRGRNGEWAEIPNDKVGAKIICRSDLLLEMVYQEGVQELAKSGAA